MLKEEFKDSKKQVRDKLEILQSKGSSNCYLLPKDRDEERERIQSEVEAWEKENQITRLPPVETSVKSLRDQPYFVHLRSQLKPKKKSKAQCAEHVGSEISTRSSAKGMSKTRQVEWSKGF